MKNILYTGILAVLLSCSSSSSDVLVDSVYVHTRNQLKIVNGVILIKLPNGVSFNWDNDCSRIVEDSLYRSLVTTFSTKQHSTIRLILDTTITSARVCTFDKNLLVGDLAFLVIDKIKGIHYALVFNVQFDVFQADCPYPFGLFSYINKYRSEAYTKVELYLNQDLSYKPISY
ncbi:hypothetical protein QNI16_13800 [Cytophagaceae bacterium YF14B1]|uniref:Lipoprotein n=1 Tax=Xanthocytophaga flava TaxID=3048013 RepID=A0AAE3QRZ3_9BACT|nr:hypothetical protein [Xanthocytophaga flavus]MDJ1481568.1 hypothetical protein [Xanthocytophaga flavus]